MPVRFERPPHRDLRWVHAHSHTPRAQAGYEFTPPTRKLSMTFSEVRSSPDVGGEPQHGWQLREHPCDVVGLA